MTCSVRLISLSAKIQAYAKNGAMEAHMSDLISGVSSYYDTYTKNNVSADNMKDKLSTDYSTATDDEMMEVCKEFEAYFTEQVFKAMQKMVPESDDSSSSTSYVSMFKDTLIQEYADLSSESNGGEGLGIAQMLYEQMKRNYGVD
jgi:flagellar protein FlgJ